MLRARISQQPMPPALLIPNAYRQRSRWRSEDVFTLTIIIIVIGVIAILAFIDAIESRG